MIDIQWDTSYCTGIDLLDTQNKHFFEMLKLLFELQQDQPEPDLFHQMFCKMADHLREHFREEEAFYEQNVPKGLDEHRTEHENFLEKLEQFDKEILHGETDVSNELCQFLRDWAVFHITCVDMNTAYGIKNLTHV